MADKLLIVLVNTDPSRSAELGAPFQQASVAAAMEYEVEMVFSGGAAKLAMRGVAETLYPEEGKTRSLYDIMKDAHGAGVTFKVCVPSPGVKVDELIPEIEETVGGAYVVSETMDDDTVTLTY